jgi:hypothetical protein
LLEKTGQAMELCRFTRAIKPFEHDEKSLSNPSSRLSHSACTLMSRYGILWENCGFGAAFNRKEIRRCAG